MTDFDQVTNYLVERAKEDPRFLDKWNKKGSLAVVYATAEEERDELNSQFALHAIVLAPPYGYGVSVGKLDSEIESVRIDEGVECPAISEVIIGNGTVCLYEAVGTHGELTFTDSEGRDASDYWSKEGECRYCYDSDGQDCDFMLHKITRGDKLWALYASLE